MLQVFEVKNDIHHCQNQLNSTAVRRLIKEANKSDSINVLSDIVAEMSLVLHHGKRDTTEFYRSVLLSVHQFVCKLD